MPTRAESIAAAITHLSRVDPILAAHIERVGPFTLTVHRDRFDMLVRSIISQQISTRAARAVRLKLNALLGVDRLRPEDIAAASDEQLRSAGLSGQKVSYLRDLSQRVLDGRLHLHKMGRMTDEAVIAELVAVRGIGPWTAQMFLMFALGRWNVYPTDDLGLRASLRELYGLPELPDKATCLRLAEPWHPWCSVATWYCWRLSDLKNDPHQDASKYPV